MFLDPAKLTLFLAAATVLITFFCARCDAQVIENMVNSVELL